MREHEGLTFPLAEYERRLRELRERMEERKLDVVLITDPENIVYLTGYQTTGYSFFQGLVIPLDQEPFMVTRLLEETNIWARTWVEVSRPYNDTGDAVQTVWHALKEFGLDDKVIGYERNSSFFPAFIQERMEVSLTEATLLDCFGIVEEGRIIKSAPEIELMRKAARATRAGMEAGIEVTRPGVSENEIAGEILSAMCRAGGEYPAVVPYVTSGPRTAIGHATWEGRIVQENECVFLEVGGCFRRYHTAMMRTVFTGDPPPAVVEGEAFVQQAIDWILNDMRPGMKVGEVDLEIRRILGQAPDGNCVTRSGYSIGIAFAPSWDEGYMLSVMAGSNKVLHEGMTLHMIPWLFGMGGGHIVGISETILITAEGCESFNDLDRSIQIKRSQPSPAVDTASRPAEDAVTERSSA